MTPALSDDVPASAAARSDGRPSSLAGRAAHPRRRAPIATRWTFERAPRRVYWELTRACELACRHCRAEAVRARDARELDTAAGVALIGRLAAFGDPKPHLVLTGGDPLKRPDLFELIAAARAAGLGVAVAPSATPLLGLAAIRRFKEVGVEAISLSLDGSSAARHDAIRGIAGVFDRTLEAACTARAVGLAFQLNTLVAAETLDDLPAIARLVASCGAMRWSLFFLVPVGRGTVLRPIPSSECERLMHWLADLASAAGPPVVTTTEAPHFRRVLLERRAAPTRGHGAGMRDGNGVMFISHTGDVQPSGFLPLSAGNVRTDDVVALYRESSLFRALRRVELFAGRCGRCEFHWQCGGSRARAYATDGNPFGEDTLCGYQPKRAAVAGE